LGDVCDQDRDREQKPANMVNWSRHKNLQFQSLSQIEIEN